MAKVIKAISAGDKSIDVNGYVIKVNISAETGNLLELKSGGLFVGSDDTKADKVANATAGNIATLDSNGNLVDSGISYDTSTSSDFAEFETALDSAFNPSVSAQDFDSALDNIFN